MLILFNKLINVYIYYIIFMHDNININTNTYMGVFNIAY